MNSVSKQEFQPRSGERLWVDDEIKYREKMRQTNDPVLTGAAQSLHDRGYVHLKNVIPADTIESAVTAYEEWCDKRDQSELYVREDERRPRIVNLHSSDDELKKLFTRSEEAVRVLDFLFGFRTSIYTSLTFQYGTEQPFHRDTPVFCTEPEEFYFGVWFALEDATQENGALRVLRGGHKDARVDPFEFAETRIEETSGIDISGSGLWAEYQDKVAQLARDEGAVEEMVPAQAGDVIIWHPQLPHSGSPIVDTSLTRRSVVYHVTPEGVPVYQANKFFVRDAERPRESKFNYVEFEDRQFVVSSTRIGRN